MPSNNHLLERGVMFLKSAIEKDENKDLAGALDMYKNALQCLMTVFKFETNPKSKQLLKQQIEKYLKRAEDIKAHVEKTKADEICDTNPHITLHDSISVEVPSLDCPSYPSLAIARLQLRETTVLPFKYPQLFQSRRPCDKILLYGPAGASKLELARLVASEAQCPLYILSFFDLLTTWLADAQKIFRDLVSFAKQSPCIIFLGENKSPAGESLAQVSIDFLSQLLQFNKGVHFLAAADEVNFAHSIRIRFRSQVFVPRLEEPIEKPFEDMLQSFVEEDSENNFKRKYIPQEQRNMHGYDEWFQQQAVLPVGWYYQGLFYEKVHRKKDYIDCYQRAAEAGYAPAQVAYGLHLLETGDKSDAELWLQKAANAGNEQAIMFLQSATFKT